MKIHPLGLAAIALALGFNIPFGMLASRFDYPDILRRPAVEVLQAFQQGGPALILIWYAFAMSAVGMAFFALAHGLTRRDLLARPVTTIGAAVIGTLAGLIQAIGLVRWVFAVPYFAGAHVDPALGEAQRAANEAAFALMNLWGGVGIGEHLGQILTIGWVALSARAQWDEGRRLDRLTAGVGALAATCILIGLGEGLVAALGFGPAWFGTATVIGYLGFSLWLVLTGVTILFPAAERLQRGVQGVVAVSL